jgi:hypothetical protein
MEASVVRRLMSERGELQRLFSNVSFRFCTRCLIQMQEREVEWKKDGTTLLAGRNDPNVLQDVWIDVAFSAQGLSSPHPRQNHCSPELLQGQSQSSRSWLD